jgi:fluoroquinolone transport system permease protein
MRRWFSSLRWDVVVQFRNGFYLVSGLFTAIWLGLLSLLPKDGSIDLGLLIPAFMVMNLLITTFYYVGALVLLEKNEGTLTALVVTPLRDLEYLAAKIVSLTGLAVVESLVIVGLVFGLRFNILPLLAGAAVLGAFYTLIGFVAIARYQSINEYLMPSALVVLLLMLPLVDYLGLWRSALFAVHPLQPLLVIMRGSFVSLAGWEIGYGIGGALLWLAVGLLWARRVYARFVVGSGGI